MLQSIINFAILFISGQAGVQLPMLRYNVTWFRITLTNAFNLC